MMLERSTTPLELIINLAPPRADAPENVLAAITLRYQEMGDAEPIDAGYLVDPLTPADREELRWYLEEYWRWPYERFAVRGAEVEQRLVAIGKRLYASVFGTAAAQALVQPWNLYPNAARQLTIASALPRALQIPWELLHDDRGFLALRTTDPVSIVRRLPAHSAGTFVAPFQPPLRILLVTARPENTGFIDPRSIARELLDEVDPAVTTGRIAVEFLRPPTMTALRQRLRDRSCPAIHILHFDGHGAFHPTHIDRDGRHFAGGAQGMLAFENQVGELDLVTADDLANVLQGSAVRLVILTACESAVGTDEDVYSSVAARLIQGGMDAVVAMSASLLVASATRYVEAFYGSLVDGASVPLAQEQARQALHDDPERHPFGRTPDTAPQPVKLRDWWLPHLYQQRPLLLQAMTPPSASAPTQLPPDRLSARMPEPPRYGWSGRARELQQIERFLLQHKVVVIHGFGGQGKTALAREAADWLTRTRMYDRTAFVSFEHGGDATTLLSEIGHFLGIDDAAYTPQEHDAALERITETLATTSLLAIADNLESILPRGDAVLNPGARAELWRVLTSLRDRGAGVILTSRDTAFGDGRLAQGPRVAYLPLGGLWPDDAYDLAVRLLESLQIDRRRAPHAELRELLGELDYHPLAIQLVLPVLRELSLPRIRAQFAQLLDRFTDDTETGRNRSLLASLEYSLQRLTDKQRAMLVRLAVFEGGAMEDDLLGIIEISEGAWSTLRTALEQAALLTVEPVHPAVAVPYLHFHPLLTPFLRSEAGADDPLLRQRYVGRYWAAAAYYCDEDARHPEAVRAIVRQELPNLRRALSLLLGGGDPDQAAAMVHFLARFLTIFGFLRELEQWRQRLDEAFGRQSESGELTWGEYLRESGRGEDEYRAGRYRAAAERFGQLLARIGTQSAGHQLGHGSREHAVVLLHLARCLRDTGQPGAAERRIRDALAMVDALLDSEPSDDLRQARGTMLAALGDTLLRQGRYEEARTAYEEELAIDEELADMCGKAIGLEHLGAIALLLHNYQEAAESYTAALHTFQALGEPAAAAVDWHQLGVVAQEQENWAEAERCYRESLALEERLGDHAGAGRTCNQLGIVAQRAGRPGDAEAWYTRALECKERVEPGSADHAETLNNLAILVAAEVHAGRMPRSRLVEARRYAEQSLAVLERLEAAEIWKTFGLLAYIAEHGGQADAAGHYLRQERETFAAFPGNRMWIDRRFAPLIQVAAAVARGDDRLRAAIEAALPDAEQKGWHIDEAIHRIWAGERDWHTLANGLTPRAALLILRILETIDNPLTDDASEAASAPRDAVLPLLPPAIRAAIEQGNVPALQQALSELELAEQQQIVTLLQEAGILQVARDVPDADAQIEAFAPLLHAAAAAVARGKDGQRAEIEAALADLESKGWHLQEPIHRIWAGERDPASLTEGLDEQDIALILRLLDMLNTPE